MLADLTTALHTTDITGPRNDDEDFIGNRALVWSRCREHLSNDWREPAGLPESERRRLIDEFTVGSGRDDEVSRSLAGLFLDYGEGYIQAGAVLESGRSHAGSYRLAASQGHPGRWPASGPP